MAEVFQISRHSPNQESGSGFQQSTKEELWKQVEDHAGTGIGTSSDSLMASFYQGLLAHSQKDPTIIDMMAQAVKERSTSDRPIDPNHMSFVVVYAINYLMMFGKKYQNYPEYFQLHDSPENWHHVFNAVLEDEELTTELAKLLREKELMSPVAERGNSIPFFVWQVCGDKQPVTAMDLGSSLGFPWMSAIRDTADNYPPFDDQTEYKGRTELLKAARARPLAVNTLYLMDHTDPRKDRDWIRACRYPGYATAEGVQQMDELMKRYAWGSDPKVNFIQGDVLLVDKMPDQGLVGGAIDVVTANKLMYELSPEARARLTEEIMPGLISDSGIAIVQDTVKTKCGKLRVSDTRDPWTSKTAIFGAITNYQWWIVLKHKTGRCDATRNGPDFKKFMEVTTSLPHNNPQ